MKNRLTLLITFFVFSFGAISLSQAQWMPINTPAPSDVDFYGVNFLNDTTGIVAGNRFSSFTGYIMTTTDGGNSWDLDSFPSHNFRSAAMMDQQTGIVVGNEMSMAAWARTTDGGQNWNVLMDTNSVGMESISRVDDQNAFSVGAGGNFSEGSVYRTSDGGANWNSVHQDSFFHYGSFFLNDTTGFTMSLTPGGQGELMKTTDGGSSWTSSLMSNNSFDGVTFLNDTLGIVAEGFGNGVIRRTTDAGMSWSPGFSITPGVVSMGMIDTANGYAVGQFGDILMTTDGGNSWSADMSPTMNQLNGLTITDTYLYSVGFNNTVIRKEHGIMAGRPAPKPLFSVRVGQNPFLESTWLEIESPVSRSTEIYLLDMRGQIIRNERLDSDKRVRIDGKGLSAGTYFVRIKDEERTLYYTRLVKQ